MKQGSDTLSERLARVIEANKALDGPCLPTLHAIQDDFGYIPREAIKMVADALNLSRAEVHGVVSFYHDLHTEPQGRHTVKLCRAEACQAAGGEAVAAELEKRLNLKSGETADDQSVTLEAVYCLGNCALSPAAVVDEKLIGRATADSVLARMDDTGKKVVA